MTDSPPTLFAQLAVAKAIGTSAKAVEDHTKARLESVMDPGDRKTATHAGRDIGTVSYSKTGAKAVVTDRAAFTKWAADNYPTEVRVRVELDADVVLAAFLHVRGDEPTGGTLEDRTLQVDTWSKAFANVMGTLQTTPAKVSSAWEEGLLARMVKAGAAIDPATGEEVPGVEYRPGGEGLSVSIRQSDAQRQAIADLHAAGNLDLVELATVPPAELEASA